MNLQNLRTFYLVATYESMSAAAEELLYAPSTVTLHIQQLEVEWGVKLFEKQGRGIKLTQDGRSILGKVKSILLQMDMLNQTVTEITEGEAGHIRIGAIDPVGSHIIAPIVAEFIRHRPLLQINFETGSIYSITDRLRAGELDLGITQHPTYTDQLWFHPLYVQRHQLLLPTNHPLNQLEIIRIGNLKDQRLLFMERVSDYDGAIFHGLVAFGSDHPYAGIEIGNLNIIIDMVRRGIGIALVPDFIKDQYFEGLIIRPVEGHDFHMTIGTALAKRGEKQQILLKFLEELQNQFPRYTA